MGATFNLWHPFFSHNGRVCEFDASRIDAWQIAHGTLQLVHDFMSQLHLDAFAKSWTVTPFCGPFFASTGHQSHWIDRHIMSWHFCVELQTRYHSPFFPFRALPAQSSMLDDTAPAVIEDDSWIFHRRRAVVLGEFFDADGIVEVESIVAGAGIPRESVTYALLGIDIVQARVDLGEINFPEEEPSIIRTVEALRVCGAKTNWHETVPYLME